jgi:uncharacterized membrane protein
MKARSADIWEHPYLLPVIVVIAAVLRLVAIGRNSLWFDEAVSYLAAELPLTDILNNTIQSSHPPLYYLLLHFWLPFSSGSDAAVRLLSFFWSILLIPAVYFLALELFDNRRTAVVAAILTTLSPFHILFTHELRMYTQLMFLVAFGVLAYLRAVKTADRRWWGLFFLLFLAAIYTHLFAWLALAAVGLYALTQRQNRQALQWTIACIALLGLLFLPWVFILLGESQTELGSMRPLTQEGAAANPIKPLTSLAFIIFGQSVRFQIMTGLSLFLTLALVIVFLLELRKGVREKAAGGVLFPLLLVGTTVGLPVLLFLVRPFFLPERTLGAAMPFLLILLAWGITRRKSPLPYLVVGSAAFMLVSSLLYLTGEPIKPPYREAVEFVAEQRQPGDAVLHTSDGSYFPALRYVNFETHGLLEGDPDPRKPLPVYQAVGGQLWSLEEAATKGQRLWLIVALEHSNEWQIEQSHYFEQRYHLLQRYDFGEINVLLYDLEIAVALSSVP